MGTFDISRINFNPAKHYTSVRMQQGRVLTDDDWNENERIEDDEERSSRIDIIGPYGSPDNGFKIEPIPAITTLIDAGKINFQIKAGTLYLGGLRLELESDETYRLQKDWLQQPITLDVTPVFTDDERYDLVYIEAWQQPVSAVEDASLFEEALGGPDTTTRVKNMRRVRIEAGVGTCSCIDAWNKLITDWSSSHLGLIDQTFERKRDTVLTVSFSNAGLPEDLCSPAIAGGYLGAENQAIRVQIVDSTHFTWGFDDASPYYRVALVEGRDKLKLLTDPKDQYHWPVSNQVVEILPWSAVLPNGEKVAEESGHLTKVKASYDPDNGTFTIVDPLPTAPPFGEEWKNRTDKNDLDNQTPAEYFYLRVWNRGTDLSSNPAIAITPGAIPLGNTGLQVTFSGNDRVANDYWVIAARPTDPGKPNRVVPWELETGIGPHGVKLFFAPLAIIRWTHITGGTVTGEIVHDCRKKFHPLTEQDCCCTFTVGDGKRSKGDFNSIQDAINNLPDDGGKICVLPGEHYTNALISKKKQVRIMGCGDQSIVMPGIDRTGDAVFTIVNSQRIQIDQLTIVAFFGTGIVVRDVDDKSGLVIDQVTIRENNILAGIHAIDIRTQEIGKVDNNISIVYNSLSLVDSTIGKTVIFSIADGVLIERNRIVVVPDEGDDPDDPRDPEDPDDGDPFNPCINPAEILRRGFSLKFQVFRTLRYVKLYHPKGASKISYTAPGGIQIGHGSESVHIKANAIIGGSGNGITLGHLDPNNTVNVPNEGAHIYSVLSQISIEENTILQMGLSGISSIFNFEGDPSYVLVKNITVYKNIIQLSARQLRLDQGAKAAFGGVVIWACNYGMLNENRIEKNGQTPGWPVCGVFIKKGSWIDVSSNNIINNGMRDLNDDTPFVPGPRGGIVILMSVQLGSMKESGNLKRPFFDGVPAVRAHDNIVSQPIGFALFLFAFGPVSIVSNQFTSEGGDRTNLLSILATTVLVLNLGISKDLLAFQFKNLSNSSLSTKTAGQQSGNELQFLPNGKTMFCANQVTLDNRAPTTNLSLCSQFIGSLDDIAYNTNQSECAGVITAEELSLSFDIVLIDVVLFGLTIRSNDNRFTEGITLTFASLLSFAIFNICTGNEATHCLFPLCLQVIGDTPTERRNFILIPSGLCPDRYDKVGKKLGVKKTLF